LYKHSHYVKTVSSQLAVNQEVIGLTFRFKVDQSAFWTDTKCYESHVCNQCSFGPHWLSHGI